MNYIVRPYSSSDEFAWDEFSAQCHQSTILHTRKFLNYHGDKFSDMSLIIEQGKEIVALFPAAVSPHDDLSVVSHPGITYGGILHDSSLRGESIVACMALIAKYYSSLGFSSLLYKVVPKIYHKAPADDDLYAIFRLRGIQKRVDLSCAIDLNNRLSISDRRKRGIKKSTNAGVIVSEDMHHLSALWEVLTENLLRKHNVSPVHNISEISSLIEKFPENIRCVCALLDGQVVAGVLLFVTATCIHSQYIASSEAGYYLSALDIVFDYCISLACSLEKRWFDFGISTEESGMILNDGLYRFKSEFGGGGVVHQFYELNLLGNMNVY